MNLRRLIRMDNKGQAMVETALVLLFLLMLVFGITEFGRAMYTKNMLNNAARAAARVAVVTPSLSTTTTTYASGSFGSASAKTACTVANFPDPVELSICQGLFYVLNYNQISATVSVAQAPGNTGTLAKTNDSVTVTVTNNGFTSLVPSLFGQGPLFLGFNKIPFPNALSGTSTMRYE